MMMMMSSEMSRLRKSRDDLVEEDVKSPGLQIADSVSMDWTDEKHSLYLNSLEASFVKQLYNHKPCSKDSRFTELNSNYQLKVLQSGCWNHNNFKRAQSQRDIVPGGSHILMENQWVRRFGSTVDHGDVRPPNLQGNGADSSEAIHSGGQKAAPFGVLKTSKKLHACYRRPAHEDSVILGLEVSDQNFVDENQEEENHLSRPCSRKRMKT